MKKKTQKTRAKANNGPDLNALALQAGSGLLEFAKTGLSALEKISGQRELSKTYPYINQAFRNVGSFLDLLGNCLPARKTGEKGTKKYDKKPTRRKRPPRHKKVQK